MAKYDFNNQVAISNSIVPTAVASSSTINGGSGTGGVDVGQASEVVATLEVGNRTDGTYTPTLQESTDNTTFTDVAAADMVGTFSALSLAGISKIGYIGTKQYIRVKMVSTSVTTGAVVAAQVIANHRRIQP